MFIIALDIGGTNIRAAIARNDGKLLQVVKENTLRHDKELFIAQVKGIITQLDLSKYDPIAISIGVPGRVRKNGFIDELPNIGIKNIDLVTTLEKTFKLPVSVRNDAEMAAFAEAVFGAGKNLNSTYFVTISTGIGGCLIVDQAIKNPSKEIGHTLVAYRGNFYELEKIASGDGVIKLAALNNIYYANAPSFFKDVAAKVPYALKIFEEWLILITDFFTFVNKAFTPDVIAVTGGVLKSKELFWDELRKRVPNANIQIAHFSEDAGLVGAASYGFKLFGAQ
ncbi:MAG: ROK family protein [Bacilli bacterium]|jgi:predicted NBD/HSP70 family sugar kinase